MKINGNVEFEIITEIQNLILIILAGKCKILDTNCVYTNLMSCKRQKFRIVAHTTFSLNCLFTDCIVYIFSPQHEKIIICSSIVDTNSCENNFRALMTKDIYMDC